MLGPDLEPTQENQPDTPRRTLTTPEMKKSKKEDPNFREPYAKQGKAKRRTGNEDGLGGSVREVCACAVNEYHNRL